MAERLRGPRWRDATRGMGQDDDQKPPLYFGDYADGTYWSAVRSELAEQGDDESDYSITGSDLKIPSPTPFCSPWPRSLTNCAAPDAASSARSPGID